MERISIKYITAFLINNKRTVLTLFFAFIFTDALFIKMSYDLVIFSVLLLWIVFVKISKIKSDLTFLLCVDLLVAMSFSYVLTNTSIITEKAAVWLILFMGLGIIQKWKE